MLLVPWGDSPSTETPPQLRQAYRPSVAALQTGRDSRLHSAYLARLHPPARLLTSARHSGGFMSSILKHLGKLEPLRAGRRPNRSSGAILGEKAMRPMAEWPDFPAGASLMRGGLT